MATKRPGKYKSPFSSSGAKRFSKPRMYDSSDWVSYSRKFLAQNPLCYACGQSARITDHLESAKGRKEVFWKEANYIPLCKNCHAIITNKFDRKETADIQGKLEWLNNKRLETGTTVRVKVVPLGLSD
jgi:5-methylcytosine-specific restriction endonuclease McrA